jgi:hypothetical protein
MSTNSAPGRVPRPPAHVAQYQKEMREFQSVLVDVQRSAQRSQNELLRKIAEKYRGSRPASCSYDNLAGQNESGAAVVIRKRAVVLPLPVVLDISSPQSPRSHAYGSVSSMLRSDATYMSKEEFASSVTSFFS